MGIRENKVETYLDTEVKKMSGITRKWVSPGRDGVPDRIVFVQGDLIFVEIKTVDGTLSPVQRREHVRLRDHDAQVVTVYGSSGVDAFLTDVVLTMPRYADEYR